MANNHGFVNTTHCTCWNVDAYKRVGIAQSDIDNGVFVTIGAIAADSNENIEGYQFAVTPATAASTGVWLVRTPEVGTTLEMAMLSDPRHFYNVKGRPMSLCYLVAGVDCIEVDANCFADAEDLPTLTNPIVPLTTGGKLGTPTNSAPSTGAYLTYLGTKTTEIGAELVPTYVLQMSRN